VKSIVERKESLLDKVAKEETELELVLKGLGLSRKKRVDSRSNKVRKAQSTKSMMGVDEGKRQVVALLVKGIWLGIEEEKNELKKVNIELGKELARSRADTLKDVKQLRASHAVAIGQLQVEAKANLDEMAEKRDRLGLHLMLIGYSEEEVNAIKVDIYVEEEDEKEAEVVGIVDGLDGVSCQTVLDNQGDDVELTKDGSEKVVREVSLRINNLESGLARERETSKALISAQAELQVEEKDSEIKNGLKKLFKVTERAENIQLQVDALAGKGKCEFEGMPALVGCCSYLGKMEKVLEGEIKANESLVKRKEELLKDLPAREELNAEIGRLHARVVDLEAMNLAEPTKYIAKLEEDVIFHAKVDAEMTKLKNNYARLESCLMRLRTRFATMIVPDASRSDMLRVILAYFVEEVKRLELERDTLFKNLLDMEYICGAKIDQGNCLGVMETQLGPRTTEPIEQGRAIVAHELKAQPLDVGGSTTDSRK
ncbi:hypothetical protein GIB67_042528, partial [Kingdonia uniflora]